MADLTTECDRVCKLVRSIASDRCEEEKKDGREGKESKKRTLSGIVEIDAGKSHYAFIPGTSPAPALHPHSNGNEEEPEDHKRRQNNVRQNPDIRLRLLRNEFQQEKEENRAETHNRDGRANKTDWVIKGVGKSTLHDSD